MSNKLKVLSIFTFLFSLQTNAAMNENIGCSLVETNSQGKEKPVKLDTRLFGNDFIAEGSVSANSTENVYPILIQLSPNERDTESYSLDIVYNAKVNYTRGINFDSSIISYANGKKASEEAQVFKKIVDNQDYNESFGSAVSQRISFLKLPFELQMNLTNGIKYDYPASIKLTCKNKSDKN